MEATLINLNDYEYSGEGANGASYNHKTDKSLMLKLYNASAPLEIVKSELEFARKVYDAGIPTPEPGDFVTDGSGRYGIRFQRIEGKKSFSRAAGDNPERVEEYARRFASMCKALHSTHLPKGVFPDIKEADLQMLAENPFFTEPEREMVARFIKSAPDGDTAIHGDLQYSNAIMSESGEYFIDLGDFSCGHPYFDLGMVLLCCVYDDDAFIRETFHMEPETAREFWRYFVKGYFGEDAQPDEIEKMLRPYAGLKVLIIERNAGMHFPNFHALLENCA